MNNPNPFVPQGSLLEQKNKSRSRMKLGVFCVLAVSVFGLTAMLIQGCKRETETTTPPEETNTMPAMDTNPPPMETSNPPVLPPMTNVAPVVPPAMTTPEMTTTEYVVVKGDTLSKIAKAHGISLKALENANPGVQPTKLKVGQKLQIPAATNSAENSTVNSVSSTGAESGEVIYTVKSGDRLIKIAKTYGVSVRAIQTENNLSTTKIKVGQKLKIPAATTAASAPAATTPAPASPVESNSTPMPNGAPMQ